MNDITHKRLSLRKASALAMVKVSSEATIKAIREGAVPKGDVFSFAKVAALFAVKKTHELIPDCHPVPVEHCLVELRLSGLHIEVEVSVSAIYRTGVEVEAMTGASLAALTIYDMLKPIDDAVEIAGIRLLNKSGGKKDRYVPDNFRVDAASILYSQAIVAGKRPDAVTPLVHAFAERTGIAIKTEQQIPELPAELMQQVLNLVSTHSLILIFGGSGVSEKDTVREVLDSIKESEIPGIEHMILDYGISRSPLALVSRPYAIRIEKTLVISLPGSKSGASEALDAISSGILPLLYRITTLPKEQ